MVMVSAYGKAIQAEELHRHSNVAAHLAGLHFCCSGDVTFSNNDLIILNASSGKGQDVAAK